MGKIRMPVTHEGRRVQASPEELNCWLGREVSEPVQIATESADPASELKAGFRLSESTHMLGKRNERPKRY
jgi:hypothetical protein